MKGFSLHVDDFDNAIWSKVIGGIDSHPVYLIVNQHRAGPWSWKLICQARILFSSAYGGEFFNSKELALEDACAKMRLVSELWNFIKEESWTK